MRQFLFERRKNKSLAKNIWFTVNSYNLMYIDNNTWKNPMPYHREKPI